MTPLTNQTKKPIITWLLIGCFLIYLMVVLGGITRLTHSGLSMVEWNLIVGTLPPMNNTQWQVPFEKYQQTPEYQLVNSHFTLEEFKSIYWWEYLHRMLGRFIGIVFLVPFLYFWVRKKLDNALLKKCLILLVLGGFQGVLGWYMVKSGLVKDPHVSHFRLAAHLLSAFAVFGVTFWVAMDLKFEREQTKGAESIRRMGKLLLSVVIIQIIYGAFVAGLKAGEFYNTFPKMGEEWFPDTISSYDSFVQNITENRAGVQFIHRYLAYAVAIVAFITWNKSRKADLSPKQKASINLVLVIVIVQFWLGVFTLIYKVPVVLGVLHQTGAFFLFAGSLLFLHRLQKI